MGERVSINVASAASKTSTNKFGASRGELGERIFEFTGTMGERIHANAPAIRKSIRFRVERERGASDEQ